MAILRSLQLINAAGTKLFQVELHLLHGAKTVAHDDHGRAGLRRRIMPAAQDDTVGQGNVDVAAAPACGAVRHRIYFP
jgi:hypothetical protein